MACDKALSVQAYFDGELDSTASLEVEEHVATCADCAALLKDLAATRSALRDELPYFRADGRLRAQVAATLDKETGRAQTLSGMVARTRDFWVGAVGGAGAGALAAAMALFAFMTPVSDALVNDVVNAHLRSVISDHTIDVASNDHHTVKPWFATHADVSPPVADFQAQGYNLVGGRVDYVNGRRTAVIVYRHGAHIINVFAWPDLGEKLPERATKNGYHVVVWRSGNVVLCAVSDTALVELLTLQNLLSGKIIPGGRE
jgi:anti-sigma factor RsiW